MDRHNDYDYYATDIAIFNAQRFFYNKPYSLENSAYLQDLISISFKSPEIFSGIEISKVKVAEDWFCHLLIKIATRNKIDLFRALLKYSNTHLKQYPEAITGLINKFNPDGNLLAPETCEKFLHCIAQERPDIKNVIECNLTHFETYFKPESFRDYVFELFQVDHSKPEEYLEYQLRLI